jgi:RNA polymerase sigma-70 factor, ECF subfamily
VVRHLTNTAQKDGQARPETVKILIMFAKKNKEGKPSEAAGLAIVDWVEKAQNGDQTAFHRLVDQFQPEIYRMLFYRTRSEMDAEDLTQDVMLKAYKNIGRLKSPEMFRSWLYRIAVNRLKDYYRRKRFKSLFGFVSVDEEGFHETDAMAVGPEVEGSLSKKDFWRQISRVLTRLSAGEKEVFLLRFFDQLSIKEMSAALQKSESTIKTLLYRALRKLKAMSGELEALLEGL